MKFNADTVPAQEARDTGPLPDGIYDVEVEQATEMDNRAGTGRYLELVLRVTDGPHRSRKLWARYTSEHQSERAQTIGMAQIREASLALGKPQWEHEVELQGCRARVKVGRQKDNNERNDVKGWMEAAPRTTAAHVDTSRRNGQLAAVVAAQPAQPAPAATWDDDGGIPF